MIVFKKNKCSSIRIRLGRNNYLVLNKANNYEENVNDKHIEILRLVNGISFRDATDVKEKIEALAELKKAHIELKKSLDISIKQKDLIKEEAIELALELSKLESKMNIQEIEKKQKKNKPKNTEEEVA